MLAENPETPETSGIIHTQSERQKNREKSLLTHILLFTTS